MPEVTNSIVDNPPHYTTRSAECIEFTRHLGFTIGNAFKYVWRNGLKDDSDQEVGKTNWYVKDAMVYRPANLHKVMLDILVRKLTMMAEEFDEPTWSLLIALLHAESGDYTLVGAYAKENKVLPELASKLTFG
jgi:hypothetical protein